MRNKTRNTNNNNKKYIKRNNLEEPSSILITTMKVLTLKEEVKILILHSVITQVDRAVYKGGATRRVVPGPKTFLPFLPPSENLMTVLQKSTVR